MNEKLFRIRSKQLKRSLSSHLSEIHTKDKALFDVEHSIFEKVYRETPQKQTNIEMLYNSLNSITILGQIFSRALSQIASEEITHESFLKLDILFRFGIALLKTLSDDEKTKQWDPTDERIVLSKEVTIEKKMYDKLKESLQSLKKNKNPSIVTLEGILLYLLKETQRYNAIKRIRSWEDILSFVYGIEIKKKEENQDIEPINIKEFLLCEGVKGKIIQSIHVKYDGLLSYTMSLLTMLSGSSYYTKFESRLNSILASLGTSTEITLLSQRLSKTYSKYREVLDEIKKNIFLLKKKMQMLSFDYDDEELNAPVRTMEGLLQKIDKETIFPPNPFRSGIFRKLLQNARIRSFVERLSELWEKGEERFKEFKDACVKLDEFLEKIVKKANTISADLFAEGFQSAVPLMDVEICEAAGLHLKNLVATSSTHKVAIDDKLIDLKIRMLREYEDGYHKLIKILTQKATEEQSLKNIPGDLIRFEDLMELLKSQYHLWNKEGVFEGFQEQIPLNLMILKNLNRIISKLLKILEPIKRTPLNQENLEKHLPVLDEITALYMTLAELEDAIILLTKITKRLWYVSRKYVMEFLENPEFILNPQSFAEHISNIPQTLNIEFRQRFISKEVKEKRLEIYKDVLRLLEKLEKIPIENRRKLIEGN